MLHQTCYICLPTLFKPVQQRCLVYNIISLSLLCLIYKVCEGTDKGFVVVNQKVSSLSNALFVFAIHFPLGLWSEDKILYGEIISYIHD